MAKLRLLAFLLVALSCARDFPDWYYHQDRTIKMPRFDGTTKIDAVVDGPMLQAMKVVEDDFLPPPSRRNKCSRTPAALLYKITRRGDIIFVEVDENPKACGNQSFSFDGAARYAVSLDGRILRRMFDVEPGEEEPSCPPSPYLLPEYREEFEKRCSEKLDAGDDGGWTLIPDGDREYEVQCPVKPGPYLPPGWREELERVCSQKLDAGLDAGTGVGRDGGTNSGKDAGSPSADGGRSAGSTRP